MAILVIILFLEISNEDSDDEEDLSWFDEENSEDGYLWGFWDLLFFWAFSVFMLSILLKGIRAEF